MKKYLLIGFVVWTVAVFGFGFIEGQNRAEKQTLIKTVTVYKEVEKKTVEQAKTAEKIKIVYRDLQSDEKNCNFVLDFDVSKCLPNSK